MRTARSEALGACLGGVVFGCVGASANADEQCLSYNLKSILIQKILVISQETQEMWTSEKNVRRLISLQKLDGLTSYRSSNRHKTVLFVSGNFYNMIHETNTPIKAPGTEGVFLEIPSKDRIQVDRLYANDEFLSLLQTATEAYHKQARNYDQCTGANAEFPLSRTLCMYTAVDKYENKHHDFVYVSKCHGQIISLQVKKLVNMMA